MLERIGHTLDVALPVMLVGIVTRSAEQASSRWEKLPRWGKQAAALASIFGLLGIFASCSVGVATILGKFEPLPETVVEIQGTVEEMQDFHERQVMPALEMVDTLRIVQRAREPLSSQIYQVNQEIQEMKCALVALAQRRDPDVVACFAAAGGGQ